MSLPANASPLPGDPAPEPGPAPCANADQALLHRFIRHPQAPLAMDATPLAAALGLCLLKVDGELGQVEMRCQPAASFVQGRGVLQGGAVAALLDFAMAYAVLATLPPSKGCATLELHTSFLRAAPLGSYLLRGAIVRRTRSIAFASAELLALDGADARLATAGSTLAIVSA